MRFTYEGFRLRLLRLYRILLAENRQKELSCSEFTIISNNCWGGMVYETYNLYKDSPTIGLYFMASDYIKFVSNLKYYLNLKLEFIESTESCYCENFKNDKDWLSYIKGRLGDVEIVFMHYHSIEEVNDKWYRRISRIHWDKLLIKFNDQNGCSKKDVEAFVKLPYKNKIFFTCKNWSVEDKDKVIIYINQLFNKDFINASHEPFGINSNFELTNYLNSIFAK